MTGNTTYEGYPYPLEGDFADVQDAYRLASALDTGLRAEQAPFRQYLARPSFIAMQATTQSGITSGVQYLQFQTVEWDNTGGAPVNATFWTQPPAQGPSWWMFGGTIRVNPTGSQVVGDMNEAEIIVQTSDQVTGTITNKNFYQRNDDTNTNGEWLNVFAVAPIYHGLAQLAYKCDGSTAKGILAGSRFWGLYLGPVS